MANINVKLKNASGDVLYPKTLWSNIEGKPSFHLLHIQVSGVPEGNMMTWIINRSTTPIIDLKTLFAAIQGSPYSGFAGFYWPVWGLGTHSSTFGAIVFGFISIQEATSAGIYVHYVKGTNGTHAQLSKDSTFVNSSDIIIKEIQL